MRNMDRSKPALITATKLSDDAEYRLQTPRDEKINPGLTTSVSTTCTLNSCCYLVTSVNNEWASEWLGFTHEKWWSSCSLWRLKRKEAIREVSKLYGGLDSKAMINQRFEIITIITNKEIPFATIEQEIHGETESDNIWNQYKIP